MAGVSDQAPPPYNFLPRCTCSWRGTRVESESAARDQVAAHLADDTNPDVGPNCVPWIEVS